MAKASPLTNNVSTRGTPFQDVGLRGSQETMRAQQVANQRPNSQNHSGKYSQEMGMASQAMKGAGAMMETFANLGMQMDTSKFTKNQNTAINKFNQSAGKMQSAQAKLSDLKNQKATAQGIVDALSKAGCEFADALKRAQDKLDDLTKQANKANTDYKNAKSAFDRAQQDFKNASNNRSIPPAQRRTDQKEALNDAREAEKSMNNASSDLGQIEKDYDKAKSDYNSANSDAQANASALGDKVGEMKQLNDWTGMTQAEQNNAINEMNRNASQMRQNGKDFMNDMKDWQMYKTAGSQTSGWSDAVRDFGNGEYWKGTASSLNQTYRTLSDYSGFSGTGLGGMVSPFFQQALTSAGQTLQNGGNAQDFGQSFLNATMGLSDLQQGFNSISNAFEYANAGDNFMSAVEANNAIIPFTDALGKMTQTGSLFAPTLQPVSPFAQHLARGAGEFMNSLGGDLISLQEIQKVANQTFENFAGTSLGYSTAPLNALASGVAEMMDSVGKMFGQDLGLKQGVQEWRKDALETFTGVDLTQYVPNVNIPTSTADANTPLFNPDSPDSDNATQDPFNQGSRGGGTGSNQKKCPPLKPTPSSLATEFN